MLSPFSWKSSQTSNLREEIPLIRLLLLIQRPARLSSLQALFRFNLYCKTNLSILVLLRITFVIDNDGLCLADNFGKRDSTRIIWCGETSCSLPLPTVGSTEPTTYGNDSDYEIN